jgi:CoA:oxalate CoA-transferase
MRTSLDCEAQLATAGVPCTTYLTTEQAMRGPQVKARGATTEVRDAVGAYLVPNAPFQMPGLNTSPRKHVPALGEHTQSVLKELANIQSSAAC